MIRIGITGPESTGKTTLSKALATYFQCIWIPEFAREFLYSLNGVYQQHDLDKIASGQLTSWEFYQLEDLCIYDTEMLVMKVWSEFKYHEVSNFIEQAWQEQQIDLYLLCATDIAWEEDDLRENPENRDELFEIYLKHLKQSKRMYVVLSGNHEQRLEIAISAIQKLISANKM